MGISFAPPYTWVPFNANDRVKVRLTDAGKCELERQHAELVAKLSNYSAVLNVPAYTVDDEGYSTFQLWSLMQALGHMCMPGGKPPFETAMFFLSEK